MQVAVQRPMVRKRDRELKGIAKLSTHYYRSLKMGIGDDFRGSAKLVLDTPRHSARLAAATHFIRWTP